VCDLPRRTPVFQRPVVVELHRSAWTQVLADYPGLELDDILAALEFGARPVARRRVVPLPAG